MLLLAPLPRPRFSRSIQNAISDREREIWERILESDGRVDSEDEALTMVYQGGYAYVTGSYSAGKFIEQTGAGDFAIQPGGPLLRQFFAFGVPLGQLPLIHQ